ncbi:MAG: hypothetical protein R3Y38_06125 [Rikenellaceae bacterium]
MKTKKIIRLLDKTSKLIKQWNDYSELSLLEKELVLSNLRKVYDAVYFLEHESEGEDIEQEILVEIETEPEIKQSEEELKPKLEHKVVLSLYEDESEQEQEEVEPEPEIEEEPEPEPETEPEPTPEPEPEKTLGEILSAGSTTLGDTYRQNAVDYAAKFSGDSLKKMIGLNDKFLLMRDLFDNNEQVYEVVISHLDEEQSLDSALIYLAENYPFWNPSSQGAKFLMDILKRKLS